MNIRLGTRGSALARYQSGTIVKALEEAGHNVDVIIIRTEGDKDQKTPFAQLGAPGLFVRAIEEALLAEDIDLAVHSYKDLPSFSPKGLWVAAAPKREDPSDAMLTFSDTILDEHSVLGIRAGAHVGTASVRRKAWLERIDRSQRVGHLRGNLPTRIQRLRDGDFDAIMLASSGLDRLQESGVDLSDIHIRRLAPLTFIPAPTQGALALQTRTKHRELNETLRVVCGHEESERCLEPERQLLRLVEGGCVVPFGAWCRVNSAGRYELHAALVRDGRWLQASVEGANPEGLAEQIWSTWTVESEG